ncbi:MAG: DnaD domain protein [Eubacterium sp.]|nr:DnaD domain protein [Eubacterium sp.]HBE08961.1 DNA replication protein DnaD [Lachnospiraceae bacterium]
MNITISTEKKETFSQISNNFIDFHMADANGEFVKVYLYLVRLYSCGRPVSVSDIADFLNCKENDVCRAIKYWVSRGVLSFTYDSGRRITGIVLKNIDAPDRLEEEGLLDFTASMLEDEQPAAAEVTEEKENIRHIEEVDIRSGIEAAETENKAPEKRKIDKKDLNSKLIDENFKDLKSQAEAYFARALTPADINMMIYIYDDLHFKKELFEYLLEYCATIGKTNSKYVEKVAINWYELGFTERQEAVDYTDTFNSLYRRIFKELGITGRTVPTPAEMEFIKKWKKEFGYDEEIIGEACRRAILSRPNSATFAYVNGILESWFKDGVKIFGDIKGADQRFSKAKKTKTSDQRLGTFGNYKQSSTDEEWDELTKMYIKEVNNQ